MIRLIWFAVCVILGGVSCSPGVPEPVEIVFNEESCSFCRMAVSQREFAAEVVTLSGSLDTFDDIGCLVKWMKEHQPPSSAGVFVVDFNDGTWISATDAAYVHSEDLPTPMSSGLAAFKDRTSAETAVEKIGGRVLQWRELWEEAVQ
jgi:copper chaperone NosL